ncbi:MAG: 30S ribosomal protein S20 [Christensenellales bacterium]|jgi:small subunit ribosomal protein S20
MPNIKSAIKRVQVSEKKRQENKMIKSKLNTYIKKFKTAVIENQLEQAQELYKEVVSLLDKAAKDNVIHKNSASRKQASLATLLQTIAK